jgi:AbrB family looped-hinge helix DNA binding protein
MPFMNTTLTMDKAGRVVLPKPVREELQLGAGDSLELEISEDQIVLRPVRSTVGLRKKQGIWVMDTDEPLSAATVDRTIRDIRRAREQSWLQPGPPSRVNVRQEKTSQEKTRKRR